MSRSFLLAHLSDPHIGATWADADPVAGLSAAVKAICAAAPRPDAVLLSGDLADNAADAEYEQVRDLIAPLRAPVYVLPGNHDDRRSLHRHFDVPDRLGDPVQYAVDIGPLRLILLDTTRPGEDDGTFGSERLAWLDEELQRAPERLTLLAMHHPPLATGMAAWDALCLPSDDRRSLGDLLERHPQVVRIVAGHVHRAMVGELAGRTVLTVPSTYVQAELDLLEGRVRFVAEPAGFAVHLLADGQLISHVQR